MIKVKNKSKKLLQKKARKGFRGYPLATIAYYGPNDKKATKVVASIIIHENAEPEPMKKWLSDNELRNDKIIIDELLEFISENEVFSVGMVDRIIGCPHEEGIDYPEGKHCSKCPFWQNRNRWTGEHIH